MLEVLTKLVTNAQLSGDLSPFIGLKEDIWFEAKGKKGYDFDKPHDIFEFAKDISAFANSEGGIIVIGLITEKHVDEQIDVVKNVDLLEISKVNISKWEGIIRENVYPRIEGLSCVTIPCKGDITKCVLAIIVPRQEESKKPFLINKMVDDSGKTRAIAYGLAERKQANNDPASVIQIWKWIKHGRSDGTLTLLRIEDKVDAIINLEQICHPERESPKIKLASRMDEMLREDYP